MRRVRTRPAPSAQPQVVRLAEQLAAASRQVQDLQAAAAAAAAGGDGLRGGELLLLSGGRGVIGGLDAVRGRGGGGGAGGRDQLGPAGGDGTRALILAADKQSRCGTPRCLGLLVFSFLHTS